MPLKKIDDYFPQPESLPIKVKDAFIGIENKNSEVEISQRVIDRWTKTNTGQTLYDYGASQIKIDPDKIAPTLHKRGSASYSVFHYDYPRPLLVDEMKRLQSFPNNFILGGGYKDRKDRIGNSVPPLFMRSIARQIRYALFDGENPNVTLKKIDYLPFLESCWQEHLKPRAENAPTVISTFAGCGGSSLGYSMAGFRELLAIEWDDNAVETFKMNFPDVPVYHGDIAKISVDEVLQMTGLKVGELDVFDGSPPCQGFSTAGKRQLDDPRNQLFREYIRLLRGLKPKVFVMENVSGMVKGIMKLVFVEILKELKASSYKVSARLLNAMYFNVPQSRQRMIFVGVREDLEIEPDHPEAENVPVTVKQALSSIQNKTFQRPLATVASRIWENTGYGENGTKIRKNYYMSTVKVHPDRAAPTISKTVSGTGAILHYDEKRTLTIEEVKRISSYPDKYVLCGNFLNQWMRIGNSVPPLFMHSIARHVRTEILDRL